MGILDILGLGLKSENFKELISKGAVIIDVRTIGEFQSGNIKGSKNMPLDQISSKVSEIKKWNKPVIVCCKSGMRSSQAQAILKSNGIEAVNGGGWESLEHKIRN